MADVKISALTLAAADGTSHVAASDSGATVTNKVTLLSIAQLFSDPSGVTGADAITNIMSLSQSEYDAITSPSTTTLYVIT